MMLVHPAIGGPILFEENKVSVLVIEEPGLFREMIIDFRRQLRGENGQFVLSRNYVPIRIQKELELIIDPLFPDFNKSKIMSKMFSQLEQEAIGEAFFVETNTLLCSLTSYTQKLLSETGVPLVCDEEISIISLLKAANTHIDFDESSPVTRLCEYMDIISELNLAGCFVFVNLKSYFRFDELQLLYKNIAYRKNFVLLLESKLDKNRMDMERTVLIDCDLCEVINEYLT